MTDARDRAIDALCDTIAELRKRIRDMEDIETIIAKAPEPVVGDCRTLPREWELDWEGILRHPYCDRTGD